jgi:phosphoglycolate phosphatase
MSSDGIQRLIVFDLDGTLIDSRRDLADSTNEMLGMYGAPPLPTDQVAMMVGEGARVLVERALHASGLYPDISEALARFREIYDERLLVHTRPYAGIPEIVRTLHGTAFLAVLTNKPEAPARRLLEAFDLSRWFTRVIGGDSAHARKPDPAGLHALMKEAGVPASRTWLVGDSMIDVETARRAGCRMCVVRYGFGQLRGELELDGSETVADLPPEIPRLIDQGMEGAA